MDFIRIEPDGTRTERWDGRVIRNAYRGRYRNGVPMWPKPHKFRPRIRVISEDEDRRLNGGLWKTRREREKSRACACSECRVLVN
jgi:hypothetical protein